MVQQFEAWADEFGGDYELHVFGTRTIVVTSVADMRRILALRPSKFKRGLTPVSKHRARTRAHVPTHSLFSYVIISSPACLTAGCCRLPTSRSVPYQYSRNRQPAALLCRVNSPCRACGGHFTNVNIDRSFPCLGDRCPLRRTTATRNCVLQHNTV